MRIASVISLLGFHFPTVFMHDLQGGGEIEVFEEDKASSRRMTRAEFKNRSGFRKFPDRIAGLDRRQP